MAKKEEYTRKLFNKGQRRIDFQRDVNGKAETFSLSPQKAASFTESEAKNLMKLFSSELIDMDNVTVEALTSAGMHDRIVRAQKAYEEARAEGFDESESRNIAGLPALPKQESQEDDLGERGEKRLPGK